MNRRMRGEDQGAIAIFVAIASVLFLLVAALVVDLGLAMEERRDAQKAADLAALAGGQELPDAAAAVDVAAEYLIDNGWGTDIDGNPVTKTDLIEDLTDADDSNGDATVIGETRLELTTPDRRVDFFFAPVGELLADGDGLDATTVSARAVVEIRSLKNILPYQIPGGSAPGILCLKDDAGPKDGDLCADRTEGNFGYLDLPRTPTSLGPVARARLNILEGAQYTPSLIPDAEVVLAEALASETGEIPCTATSPSGAVLASFSNPQDGFNCAPVEPGTFSVSLQDGLIGIGGAPVSRCKGRLGLTSSTADSLLISGCHVSGDRFPTYINPSSDMSNPNSWGPIDPTIANDPRFGVAPVVASRELSRVSAQYPIVRFYGVYYKDFYDVSGNIVSSGPGTRISAVSAYVFPLNLIDGVLPNDQGTIPYIGGAKIPVLVE